jgi:hypothetical protein
MVLAAASRRNELLSASFEPDQMLHEQIRLVLQAVGIDFSITSPTLP